MAHSFRDRFHDGFRIACNLTFWFFNFHRREHLIVTRSVPIVTNSLTPKLPAKAIQSVDRLNAVIDRAIARLRHAIIDVALSSREHMNVLLSAYVHRRDKMWRQLTLMFDDVSRSRIYRFLIALVHVNTECLCSEGMHVSTRTECVFAHISPREVGLNSRRRFRHQ